MKANRHPSLTPLRALALLRSLEAKREPIAAHELREVKDALAEHGGTTDRWRSFP